MAASQQQDGRVQFVLRIWFSPYTTVATAWELAWAEAVEQMDSVDGNATVKASHEIRPTREEVQRMRSETM